MLSPTEINGIPLDYLPCHEYGFSAFRNTCRDTLRPLDFCKGIYQARRYKRENGQIELLQEDSASAILSTIWEPVRFPQLALYVSYTKLLHLTSWRNKYHYRKILYSTIAVDNIVKSMRLRHYMWKYQIDVTHFYILFRLSEHLFVFSFYGA